MPLTREEIQKVAIAQVMCRSPQEPNRLLNHTRYFFQKQNKRKYNVRYHHEVIGSVLERVLLGKCRRLAISVAPRLGKTELAVIAFIAHAIGLNPAAKFIHLSATDALALENSEKIRDIISSPEYQLIYPGVKIKQGTAAKKKWYTTAGGGLYALSAGGQVTGFGAGINESEASPTPPTEGLQNDEALFLAAADDENKDGDDALTLDTWCMLIETGAFGGAIIYDDSLKPEDGLSDIKREAVNRRYVSTIKNRVNSRNTPIIIIQQRVHKHDLIGYVLEIEPNEWETLVIPELYVDKNGTLCCLDPTIRTVDDLVKMEKSENDEVRYIFQTQHQQNPQTREGLMFPLDSLKLYDPKEFDALKNAELVFQVVDPADSGEDCLSAPYIAVCGKDFYLFDVIFNRQGTDYNEPLLVEGFQKYKVKRVNFEANNAWRIMLGNIKRKVSEKRINTEVFGFVSKGNKHTRILAEHAFIKNRFYFRKDWQTFRPEYRAFMLELTGYLMNQVNGGNLHDDAPDAMSMASHYVQTSMSHLM